MKFSGKNKLVRCRNHIIIYLNVFLPLLVPKERKYKTTKLHAQCMSIALVWTMVNLDKVSV